MRSTKVVGFSCLASSPIDDALRDGVSKSIVYDTCTMHVLSKVRGASSVL
jgi:hypothetical protein